MRFRQGCSRDCSASCKPYWGDHASSEVAYVFCALYAMLLTSVVVVPVLFMSIMISLCRITEFYVRKCCVFSRYGFLVRCISVEVRMSLVLK